MARRSSSEALVKIRCAVSPLALLLIAGVLPVVATPIFYTIEFSLTAGTILPVSGAFAYDPSLTSDPFSPKNSKSNPKIGVNTKSPNLHPVYIVLKVLLREGRRARRSIVRRRRGLLGFRIELDFGSRPVRRFMRECEAKNEPGRSWNRSGFGQRV